MGHPTVGQQMFQPPKRAPLLFTVPLRHVSVKTQITVELTFSLIPTPQKAETPYQLRTPTEPDFAYKYMESFDRGLGNCC